MATRTASRRPVKGKSTSKTSARSGLSVRTFSGLNKKRMEKKGGGNFGVRLRMDSGVPVPVQFLTDLDGFVEYDMHVFKEDNKWTYVPCLGDNCPLCDDEDSDRSKINYRFIANVYNLAEKKVQVMEGPKDLATRIAYRQERSPAKFLKRTFEVTKLDTQPVSYDVSLADEPVVRTTSLTLHDLEKYVNDAAKSYYGDQVPQKSALDADDDLDDEAEDDDTLEDEEFDEDELREELEELSEAKLLKRAKTNGAKKRELEDIDMDDLIDLIIEQETPEGDDEDDDEDEDDDDLDDEDEDEDDPAPPKRAAKKLAKKPAKKAAARRR